MKTFIALAWPHGSFARSVKTTQPMQIALCNQPGGVVSPSTAAATSLGELVGRRHGRQVAVLQDRAGPWMGQVEMPRAGNAPRPGMEVR